ncbi:hypothetical protein L596_005762 [Steinernema carpocapsae]|uniref:ISXO2-like transposase domain-containing protein n=1 Tax=Steinernema carpocapsae TaxID=34508 RepID=A0A4U8V4G7_STECR|nr:hypothetical protein L596_005762 [Steinernema carpocapsae]
MELLGRANSRWVHAKMSLPNNEFLDCLREKSHKTHPTHPERKKSLRTAAELFSIIQRHCRPGTTIISDEWSGYGGIEKLPEGYLHVDSSTGAHTQTIESSWQKLKAKHKERYGTHRHMLTSYLDEHDWRKKFGDIPFYHFWKCVSKIYDLTMFGGPDVKE